MADAHATEALVLAGGQSRRMRTHALPAIDKGLMYRHGQPQIYHVCNYLRTQGLDRVWISSNRHAQDYALYGQVVADDPEFQDCGPLAGVLAGLRNMQGQWLFVLPVDVVHWPDHMLASLMAAVTPSQPAYARTPDGPHPLCLVLHRSLQDALAVYLRSGQCRVQAWLRVCNGQAVDFPDADCLRNLNTPEDWIQT
ncbi:molybdenum cofactor guanylyltransferase [Castellaniella sp.]|uniref:molybdenum cofactor guanylyltransferase n=1 Tax=Castellaniella sp. TaxID=1955812 RepID=UPI002AFE7795|nr:molybdenum cofactor guanylyltransferase [Castellaniella sp.]